MGAGANSSAISTLENPDVYEYIDFSGLLDAYRHTAGCPLVESDGDILQRLENEEVFCIKRPTPDEARKLLMDDDEDESVSMADFGDIVHGL